MDKDQIIRHLRAWVDGFDPANGSALPLDHPAQRADTLRVLFAAIAHLTADVPLGLTSGSMRGNPTARNAGRPWSDDDDAALASAYDTGATIGALAMGLERTPGAITARLVKLGKIEPPPGFRMRESIDARSESPR